MPEEALDSAFLGASHSSTRRGHGGAGLVSTGSPATAILRRRAGLKVPAKKNTRSNPLSKLLFCPGQGDLSKIDMRMDLVCFVITVA
jgi:hypothetical protein